MEKSIRPNRALQFLILCPFASGSVMDTINRRIYMHVILIR